MGRVCNGPSLLWAEMSSYRITLVRFTAPLVVILTSLTHLCGSCDCHRTIIQVVFMIQMHESSVRLNEACLTAAVPKKLQSRNYVTMMNTQLIPMQTHVMFPYLEDLVSNLCIFF